MEWINKDQIGTETAAFVYEIRVWKNNQLLRYIGYRSIYSGWENYIGSSTYLLNDKNLIVEKEILKQFRQIRAAHRYEIFLISKLDAVKQDKFYNKCNYSIGLV